MIDTIVLRLHNLKKYETLTEFLNIKDKKGFNTETGLVNPSEVRKIRRIGKTPNQIIDILKLRNTGEFLVKTQRSKRINKSSHYEFSYVVDWQKDHIEMNFSIPKYKYGTNILMYIEHSRDRDYIYFENSILKYNIEKAPDFFMHFIKYFFRNEFILYDIDFSDVEINRIDVCFNQVFATRQDALYYLDYQKKIRKKHSREEGDVFYESSLMSITKRHSEKIYHKGTEYKKHDLKQHQKINNEKGRKIFDIEKLQEFADRILRYEITLRNPELNYLFKHNIFRKKCAIFKINLENYKRIGNIKKRNERTAKAIAELPPSERALYTKLHPYEAIDKNDSSTFKYVSHLMESSPKFMLAISSESDLFNKYTVVNAASDKALFSKKLIGLCLQKLSDYIHNFQLRELPAEEVISISIDNYNLSHRHKLPKADMIQFYLLLAQTGSFKEANKLSRYSHATLYRYKDRFKKIGISENHIKPDDNFSLPEAPIDLKEYHAFLTRNNHVIKTTHIEYGL